MKLNKTQRHVLRHIFGYNDGFIRSQGSPMPIIRDSREHQFAKELSAAGLAEFFVKGENKVLYVQKANHGWMGGPLV